MTVSPSRQQAHTDLKARVLAFMDEHVYPAEAVYYEQQSQGDRWTTPAVIDELKAAAGKAGLWNLFMPPGEDGQGLSNVEYAPLCEIMGRSPIGPEAFNCSAPDTGNMETLHRYGSDAQKRQWLEPLLAGEIRSAFAMTEPAVASSDATNIQAQIRRDGDDYVINARKWWTSGAGDPRCRILILMGKTDEEGHRYKQQSMVLVPIDTPGITILRHLNVFGYDDAPKGHMEVDFKDVRVPCENMLLGEGRGFEIAQGRLGPGRIHHCMRLIGVAERSLEAMCARVKERVAFGKPLAEQGVIMDHVARSRMEIEQARALVMHTAALVDDVGGRGARSYVAMIKVAVPNMALKVIDRAIQAHGGAGVCDDFGLAKAWASSRTLRLADGPDDVHLRTVAREELGKPADAWHGRSARFLRVKTSDTDADGIPAPGFDDPELIVPRDDEQLDLGRLEPWLRDNLEGAKGKLAIAQFRGGRANLTYLLRFGDREYVLRRPPLGPIAPGSHDMGREHRVLSRLWRVFPLAPRCYLHCTDESLIGAPFQVMERREGQVIRRQMPDAYSADWTCLNGIASMLVDVLVALHQVDREAADLASLGHPEGFVERQLEGWAKRWYAAAHEENSQMDRLVSALRERLPDSKHVALLHNDFKLDNLLLDAADPTRAVAILDWDMCTSGDPLVDLGYLMNQWVEPGDDQDAIAMSSLPSITPGFPDRAWAVSRYQEATGVDASGVDWYYAFAAMKFAAVVQQIYIRFARGQTKDTRFAHYDERGKVYIRKGLKALGSEAA